jgi:hypothetical protein
MRPNKTVLLSKQLIFYIKLLHISTRSGHYQAYKIRKGRLVDIVTIIVAWCKVCQGAVPVQFVFAVQLSTLNCVMILSQLTTNLILNVFINIIMNKSGRNVYQFCQGNITSYCKIKSLCYTVFVCCILSVTLVGLSGLAESEAVNSND